MALLERVTTLIKANINDLVSKAEHPEKLLRQLLLDMENQYMQVKTQVAMAIADQHLLRRKQAENLGAQQDWVRKAELALSNNDEGLARAALDRSLTYETAAQAFNEQLADQAHQIEMLKTALHRLERKMAETRSQADLLIARHRRAKLTERAAGLGMSPFDGGSNLNRLADRVNEVEAIGAGQLAVAEDDSAERQLERMERAERVERLLAELKQKA